MIKLIQNWFYLRKIKLKNLSCLIQQQIFDKGCEKRYHPDKRFEPCDKDWNKAMDVIRRTTDISFSSNEENEIAVVPAHRVRVYDQ